jgi:5-methylcytosine-specific restriction endonuclease McrA
LTWRTIAKRDGLLCWLCGQWTDPDDFDLVEGRDRRSAVACGPTYPTLDHVVALSRGGDHVGDNVRLACHACNTRKGDRDPAEYLTGLAA